MPAREIARWPKRLLRLSLLLNPGSYQVLRSLSPAKCVPFRALNYPESSEPEMETFMSPRMVLLHLELAGAGSASAEHTFRLLFFPKGKTCTSQHPEKPVK